MPRKSGAKRGKFAKLSPLKLGTAAGIILAIWIAIATLAGILQIPGFMEFGSLITSMYGAYGYSVSWLGILVGAIYGFIEAFIPVWLIAILYNKLI